MPFTKGNEYRIKPKHTPEDLEIIRTMIKNEENVEDIFAIMLKRRPDVSVITLYRWIEKVAREK